MKSLITVKFSILFALLFAASISFTACSDVAGPNNDESSIVMSEEVPDLQELRRRGARTTAAGEGSGENLSCSLGTKDLRFGGQQEKVGEIDIRINDGKLIIDFKADGGWEFSETVVGINIVRNNGQTQPFGQWSPGSVPYSPKVTQATREVNIQGSPYNITPGSTFSVGAKAQAHQVSSSGEDGETSTAGDLDMTQGQANYFNLTWECPAQTVVIVNGAG